MPDGTHLGMTTRELVEVRRSASIRDRDFSAADGTAIKRTLDTGGVGAPRWRGE
jgi:hypothetical protein